MFFNTNTSLQQIQSWIATQYNALGMQKNGYDVELKPHRNKRSNQQNRFLMAILVKLVQFYQETGFMPSGLSHWAMRTDILKEYYKARFGIGSTSNLDTSAFKKFTDDIQHSLILESHGNWEILEPDSAYIQSLLAEGGY